MANMILLDFTGKTAKDGRVFETTIGSDAKSSGQLDQNQTYQPVPIVLGQGQLLPKLEEALAGMKAGETKQVKLSSKDAFGDYDSNKVGLVAMAEFKKHQTKPVPGLTVDVNGMAGKIQSVSGGRVRVDFNHELAGQDVEYFLKVHELISEPKAQVQALAARYIPLRVGKVETDVKGDEIFIKLPFIPSPDMVQLKHFVADQLMRTIDSAKKVTFSETIEKHEHKA